jgi:hypothetical protein
LPWIAVPAAVWLGWLSLAHGNTFRNYDCGGDVVGSYEAVGAHLQRLIPAGASVYWAGGLSPVPLLYLPRAEIFPAQLNGDYSFRMAGSGQPGAVWLLERRTGRDLAAAADARWWSSGAPDWLAPAVGSGNSRLRSSPLAVGAEPIGGSMYRRVK